MEEICDIDEINNGKRILLNNLSDSSDHRSELEAIILEVGDSYVGWLNYCQHITTVRLDKGSGINLRGDEIVCSNHGAMFQKDNGECTYGPCKGAHLSRVEVTVEDDKVFLTDDNYELIEKELDSSDIPSSTTGESDYS